MKNKTWKNSKRSRVFFLSGNSKFSVKHFFFFDYV